MKKIAHILLFLFLPALLFGQTLTKETIDQIKSATVYLQVEFSTELLEIKSTVSGSGFFITDDGYIATNYHVIQPLITYYSIGYRAEKIEINAILNSGSKDYRSVGCDIMAVDKLNDLAILKVNEEIKTPYLELHTTDDQVETSPIWVFGFPFGESFAVIQRGPEITVTKGGITSLRHNDSDVLNTIQVDAVVNPGNSGGPCVNSDGKVVGIINMSGGETKHNFGIPAHYLARLINCINTSDQKKGPVELNVECSLEGAKYFLGTDDASHNPDDGVSLQCGWQSVYVVKEGYEQFMTEVAIKGDTTLTVDLSPIRTTALNTNRSDSKSKELALTAIPFEEDLVFESNFDDPSQFEHWEQNTGGMNEHTWFIEDGQLKQFEDDGVLHSIYLGESDWDNYFVRTKMKIEGKDGDPRAGLIFRESEDGFYLFRIYQESNKAQLAYHSKHPFGWNVLMETDLENISDEWYDVAVYISGDKLACYLNSECIFYTTADYSSAGRVGFYSVESKPSFKELKVEEVGETDDNALSSSPGVRSFWFTEHFDMESSNWYQYQDLPEKPRPWQFGDLGCSLIHEDEHIYVNEFRRFELEDFDISVLFTLGGGGEKAVFDFYFGKKNNQQFLLRFDKSRLSVSIIALNGDGEKLLEKEKLPLTYFGDIHRLDMTLSDGEFRVRSDNSELIKYEGKAMTDYQGLIGFSCANVRLALHQLHAVSVRM